MPEPTVEAIRELLEASGNGRLAAILDGAELHSWNEPDEALGLLHDDWAYWYAHEIAELVVPPGALDGLSDAQVECVGDAVLQALGGVDYWRIVEADEPDDEEPAEGIYAPLITPKRLRPRPAVWQGMQFRSQSELRVAQALERENTLFFANGRGRVGPATDSRESRESDFLVISHGKLGILEVDGPTHAGRAADDHDRDRLFGHHGIRVIERYTAERCYAMPDDVVAEFLRLLELNG